MKPAQLRTFHRELAKWYAAHGRHDLPWRTTSDPYHIWLSEVMLQQTQVATVRDRFYGPFLDKFPTVAKLAAAPREAVMKAWEGLGYYRRAGFLHEAAQAIGKGRFPRDEASLIALSGIGKNTARAILAFAYHQPVAILEANVKRVVARVFALEHPTDNELWEGAETLLNHAEPFNYNQAMMDVGSQICTPKNPRCGECPANTLCQGQGDPEIYPAPKAKKRVPVREVNMLVIEDASGKYYLEKRDAALLGGLYGFVQWPVDAPLASALPRGTSIASSSRLGQVSHVYSHFRLEGVVRHLKLANHQLGENWHTREQIDQRPLSGVDRKVVLLIDNSHTRPKKTSKARRKRSTH
jgi:A/G-specific adenine glycosylase